MTRRRVAFVVASTLVAGVLAAPPRAAAAGATVTVRNTAEFRAAAGSAKPGTRIELASGTYDGGTHLQGLRGTEKAPIVIAAADPAKPPLFQGGANGIQLSDPEHVELRDLAFAGQTGNGLNIDDGGTPETPAHHVVLRGLTVRDVGPDGNHDGIKLSGLTDFRVEDCTVERWGRGGSGIDMVGCRKGTIEGCTFRHTPDLASASGVQAKGATRDVVIRRNRFENAGGRAVNAGGSTGLAYFRPPLDRWTEPKFEAKDLTIEGNTFVGGQTPVAFVGVDGAVFRFNTVHVPGRWALRILQENREPGFVPCRNVVFTDNLIAFRSDRWSEGGANRGDATEPATFRFERNFWWCTDAPGRTRELVRMPTEDKDATYGKDPKFRDAEKGDLSLREGSPAARHGATSL